MSRLFLLGAVAWLLVGACALDSNDHSVHGRVVDRAGTPVPDVRVLILGEMLVTDDEGRFDSRPLTTPTYDLLIESNLSETFVYAGMSSLRPTITFRDTSISSEAFTDFTLTMPEANTDTIKSTQFFTVEGGTPVDYWFNFDSALPSRPYSMRWRPSERGVPASVHAIALQYETDPMTGAPARYIGFDEIRLPIGNGDSVAWTVEWEPYPWDVGTLIPEPTLPADYAVWETRVSVKIPGSPWASWFLTGDGTTPMLVPDGQGFTYDIESLASGDSNSTRTVRGVVPSDTPIAIAVESGPAIVAPGPDSATLQVGTRLQWTNEADLPVFILMLPDDPFAPGLMLMSSGTEVEVPDISAFDAFFPPGASYQWAVFSTTANSVDELAALGTTENLELPASTYAYSGYQTLSTP